MQSGQEPRHDDVIHEAVQCAVNADRGGQAGESREPTQVVDMATTGDIPEGYTHLIFGAFDRIGYVISRNREGKYKAEIRDKITR